MRRVAGKAMAEDHSVTIVHGDALGADRMCDEVARLFGFAVESHPVTTADWHNKGKRAGILRNIAMLDLGADEVIAFHDGQSKGTRHTINASRERGLPVRVIGPRDAKKKKLAR